MVAGKTAARLEETINMVLIRNTETVGWERAAAAELRRLQNIDDAAPVGAKKLRPKEHTATEITRNHRGRLVYGAEVPLEVYRDEVSLPSDVAELAGVSRFQGWLFQMRGREAVQTRGGATIVLAKYPPSKNYVVTGYFKKTTKDQKRGIERHLKPLLAAADAAKDPADTRLAETIARLSYTPFTNAYPALAAWGLPKQSSRLIGAERRDESNRGPVPKPVIQDIIDHRHEILDFAIRISFGGFIDPHRVAGWPVARWAAMVYHRFAYAAQSRIEDRKGSDLLTSPSRNCLTTKIKQTGRVLLSRTRDCTKRWAIPKEGPQRRFGACLQRLTKTLTSYGSW